MFEGSSVFGDEEGRAVGDCAYVGWGADDAGDGCHDVCECLWRADEL